MERGAFSNKSEPKPSEARTELLRENSNQAPRLGKRKWPSDALEEEVAELKRRLGRRDETIAELHSREAQLKEDMTELQAYYEEEEERLVIEKEDQEEQFRILQEKMDTEIWRLAEEKEDCEEQVRKAQESAFRQMKAGRWVPREDSSIRSDLKKLEGKIRNWARTHSSTDLRCFDTLSSEEISQVEDMLHEGICAPTESLPATMNRWPVRHKAPMLLVHAVIAKITFQEIFNRPFYLFDEDQSTAGDDLTRRAQYSPYFGTDLERLYARMQHGKYVLIPLG